MTPAVLADLDERIASVEADIVDAPPVLGTFLEADHRLFTEQRAAAAMCRCDHPWEAHEDTDDADDTPCNGTTRGRDGHEYGCACWAWREM